MVQFSSPRHIDDVEQKGGRNNRLNCAGQFMIAHKCQGYKGGKRCPRVLGIIALCTGTGKVFVPESQCRFCGLVTKGRTIRV